VGNILITPHGFEVSVSICINDVCVSGKEWEAAGGTAVTAGEPTCGTEAISSHDRVLYSCGYILRQARAPARWSLY
jgi:hypothetical protein